ncbi:MAG TPA: response regulator [Ignavibacteria bacterium]|nr:response regulator [Ignavibacteria bacterium]
MAEEKPRVIIVDDEKGLRMGTKRLLESEGYIVDTAENGTEGIALGTTGDYDMAIIDLKMPDIDGIEVLRNIKEKMPNTVCFIATAYASYETAIEATKLGAASYIPKPFTPDELINHLQEGYEKRKLILDSERLRKEREERLLEIATEKSRLNTIVNSIADGVLVTNLMGELVLFNPASMKYFELSNSIIGEYILDFLPASVKDIILKVLNNKESSKSFSAEIELKPNRELVVDVTCSPVPQPDGSLIGVVTVITNITELKRLEYVKSQFVSMVAHELKTPVAAVLGFLRIILDQNISTTPEQENDYLSRSEKRLQALVEMVNDLLDISRMEMKTKQREIKDIDIPEVVKSNLDFLELELQKRGIKVIYTAEENLPMVKADSGEVNRIFTNIISNAMKYNKDNGTITASVKKSGNYIVCAIKDTGIGMRPQDKEKLFQEFYRIKNDKTRNIPGTGLGLSIVKRLIESYSGKIEVNSEYGEGSEFIVYLPYKK